jgi:hypothetical protein
LYYNTNMTISEYEAITGLTVTNEALTTAQIARTQRMLETMLGYTLDVELFDTNQYTEIGKTASECPCPDVDVDALDAPDEVVGAYRIYAYNSKDSFIGIDPASEIHKVKLVKDGITFKTFEEDEYLKVSKHGFIKYLQECDNCCWCTCTFECYCTQLAVDADWLWPEDLPADLLDVWAEMVTFYSDPKKDIQSEKLGSHSYTKYYENAKGKPTAIPRPEMQDYNLSILKKYAGPNGSLYQTITI